MGIEVVIAQRSALSAVSSSSESGGPRESGQVPRTSYGSGNDGAAVRSARAHALRGHAGSRRPGAFLPTPSVGAPASDRAAGERTDYERHAAGGKVAELPPYLPGPMCGVCTAGNCYRPSTAATRFCVGHQRTREKKEDANG